MNDFGTLANDTITYGHFSADTGRFDVSYISGWFETHLGELNGLTHEEFYIDASGDIGPSGLKLVEENIFRKLYEISYYEKASREALKGIVWSNGSGSDFVYIKEGDSVVQKVNKNSVSKTALELAQLAKKDLNDLIFQYNMQKSSPLQVAGEDGETLLEAK